MKPLVRTLSALLLASLMLGVAAATPATDLLEDGLYAKAYEVAMTDREYPTASEAALAMAEYRETNDMLWLDRSEDAIRDVLKTNPNNARAHLLLGSALGRRAALSGLSLAAFNLSRACRREYERTLNLDPRLAEASVNLARWYSGAYAKAGRLSGGDPNAARRLAVQAQKDGLNNP